MANKQNDLSAELDAACDRLRATLKQRDEWVEHKRSFTNVAPSNKCKSALYKRGSTLYDRMVEKL